MISRFYYLLTIFLFFTLISCNPDNKTVEGYCGNGIKNKGEECDEGFGNSNLAPDACRNDCTLPSCGDGIKDSNEECDSYQLDSMTCSLLGFDRGVVSCSDQCTFDTSLCSTCGNGVAEPAEDCDQNDLGGAICSDFGFNGGTLGCYDGCVFDFSLCSDGCGNGIIEENEECDNESLQDRTCITSGFESGTLSCNESCVFDYSGCLGGCGNGIVEEGESCDDLNQIPEDGCYNCISPSSDFQIHEMFLHETPSDFGIADFDGDGEEDIVVSTISSDSTSGSLKILFSADNYQNPQILAEGSFVSVVALNHDNNQSPGIFAVSLTSDGTASYHYFSDYMQPEIVLENQERPKYLISEDINNDGYAQVIFSSWPSQSIKQFDPVTGEITVLLELGGDPGAIGVLDFNFDGIKDLLVVRSSSQLLSMILGFADGSYSYHSARYIGGRNADISVGDLNGNGYKDILLTDLATPRLYLLKGGAEGLSTSYFLDLEYEAHQIEIANLNGDSVYDLVLSFPSDNSVDVFNATGDYNYEFSYRYGSCTIPLKLKTFDMNRDGLTDIIFICTTEKKVVYLNALPEIP